MILHSGSAVSHFRESQYKHNGCYLLGEGRRGRGDLGDSVPKGRGESEWDGSLKGGDYLSHRHVYEAYSQQTYAVTGCPSVGLFT